MIKKALFICMISVLGIALYAQPVAKSIFLGGSIGMYYQKDKYDSDDETRKTTQFNFSPKMGYFISERTAIGLKLELSSGSSKTESDDQDTRTTETIFSITPFMRYYLTQGAVGFFTEASCNIGFGGNKHSIDSYTEKGSITQVMAGISPGIYYYVHPKLAFEFSAGWLGYQYYSEEVEGEKRKQSTFGFDIATTGFSLGAIIIL